MTRYDTPPALRVASLALVSLSFIVA
jgi:hypothetical protein